MQGKDLPNLISILRICLVPPFVLILSGRRYDIALLLFSIAGFSDALDGFLAKRYQWQSRLGAILDPLADKLLLVSGYLTLAWLGMLPLWLALVVVARDLVIVTGAVAYYIMIERYDMEPSIISKVNTLFQLLLVFVILVHWGLIMLPGWVLTGLTVAVLITTVLSGAAYVVTWSLRTRAALERSRCD